MLTEHSVKVGYSPEGRSELMHDQLRILLPARVIHSAVDLQGPDPTLRCEGVGMLRAPSKYLPR